METKAEAQFHALPPERSFLYFTEQGDGSGQVLLLVPSLVQLHEARHQVTVATVSITNEPRLTETPGLPGAEGWRLVLLFSLWALEGDKVPLPGFSNAVKILRKRYTAHVSQQNKTSLRSFLYRDSN